MAWLVAHLDDFAGSGIIYTLTVAQAEDLAALLARHGHKVAAYTGRTEPAEREELENRLRNNDVKALVATSALGMGFDKPDLGFVIHLGAPSSPGGLLPAGGSSRTRRVDRRRAAPADAGRPRHLALLRHGVDAERGRRPGRDREPRRGGHAAVDAGPRGGRRHSPHPARAAAEGARRRGRGHTGPRWLAGHRRTVGVRRRPVRAGRGGTDPRTAADAGLRGHGRVPDGIPPAHPRRPRPAALRTLRPVRRRRGSPAAVGEDGGGQRTLRTRSSRRGVVRPGRCGRQAWPTSGCRCRAESARRKRRALRAGCSPGSPTSGSGSACGHCSPTPTGPCPEWVLPYCFQVLREWDWAERPVAVVAIPSRRRPELVQTLARGIGPTRQIDRSRPTARHPRCRRFRAGRQQRVPPAAGVRLLRAHRSSSGSGSRRPPGRCCWSMTSPIPGGPSRWRRGCFGRAERRRSCRSPSRPSAELFHQSTADQWSHCARSGAIRKTRRAPSWLHARGTSRRAGIHRIARSCRRWALRGRSRRVRRGGAHQTRNRRRSPPRTGGFCGHCRGAASPARGNRGLCGVWLGGNRSPRCEL